MRVQHLRQKKRGGFVFWGVVVGVLGVLGELGVGVGTRAFWRAARAAGAVEGKLKRCSRGRSLLHKAQRK